MTCLVQRLLAAASLLILTGCGEPTATVSGIVLLDGAPLTIGEDMRGTVMFQPVSHEGPTLNGVINGTGSYELASGSNKLVRPGEYMATVSAVEILPASEHNPQPTGRRMTPNRYATASDSNLKIVVAPGPNSIELRLISDPEVENDVSEEVEEGLDATGLRSEELN